LEHDVLQRGEMGEEVERLEHHPDVPAKPVHIDVRGMHREAVHDKRSSLDRLEAVDRPQQRALARSRWADDDDDLALVNRERDATEHMKGTEVLVDVVELDHGLAGYAVARLGPWT
jgi:hypothetical protein